MKDKINIKKKDVKYYITNSCIPVTITHNGDVYFDYTTDDRNEMDGDDLTTASDCLKNKFQKTAEYIKSEGFIDSVMYKAMISAIKSK